MKRVNLQRATRVLVLATRILGVAGTFANVGYSPTRNGKASTNK